MKLDNYYCPEELIAALEKFVNKYNKQRYHESLKNLTPAYVYFGRGYLILKERKKIKQNLLKKRKEEYEK